MTTGATNDEDWRAFPMCANPSLGSNYHPRLDFVAPGDDIFTARMGGGYGPNCGTSFASPLVAGLLGIMRSINPSLGREEARHLIQSAADDEVGNPLEDTPGFDVYHGWGRVNMDRSVRGTLASITMRVNGKTETRPYFDMANPLADSYDFVRGDLSSLSESFVGVDPGTLLCLENDSPDPDTTGNEDLTSPAVGEAFVYLARFNAGPSDGWGYGGSTMNRDRLPFGPGDCPACNNGFLETGEICDGIFLGGETCQTQGFDQGTLVCNSTCDGFDASACSTCGNNVCEILGGENCVNCANDCNGVQSGNPGNRYCCGFGLGGGDNPVGCVDPRCTANGNTCSD
jgi:hypothetical protein